MGLPTPFGSERIRPEQRVTVYASRRTAFPEWTPRVSNGHSAWRRDRENKATTLIGFSTLAVAFLSQCSRNGREKVERNIIFPLSNPSHLKSEATEAEERYDSLDRWTRLCRVGFSICTLSTKRRKIPSRNAQQRSYFSTQWVELCASGARRAAPTQCDAGPARALAANSPALKDLPLPAFSPERQRRVARILRCGLALRLPTRGLDPKIREANCASAC